MPLYTASFANVYAFAKKELPALEGETPKLKCYAICTDQNFDTYTGFTTKDKSGLVDTLQGSGEQIGTTAAGDEMDAGDALLFWCDEPTSLNSSTNAGYITDHSFGVLYIDKPALTGLVGSDAPHNRATINSIRKALRNAAELIGDDGADFPDFSIGDQYWSASAISEMQQWIIDNCGSFVHPDRITDASNLTKAQVTNNPEGQGHLTIAGYAINSALETTDPWHYLCLEVAALKDGNDYGFRYADTIDPTTETPLVEYPGDGSTGPDPAGDRVCAINDYVLTLQLKDIATALEFLHGALTTFEWTANATSNWLEGESDETTDFNSWSDAQDDAELNATAQSLNLSPSQESLGSYTEDPPPDPTPTPTPPPDPTPTLTPPPDPTPTPTPPPLTPPPDPTPTITPIL